MFDKKRQPTENEWQYLWRLGQAKESGLIDYSWQDLADLINQEFHSGDERTESVYRKNYATACRFFEAGVFGNFTDKNYLEELTIQKNDIRIEKQKLSDERCALNRISRELARKSADYSYMSQCIQEIGKESFPYVSPVWPVQKPTCDFAMIICISDFHLGLSVDNYFGKYDVTTAQDRLNQYFEEIIKFRDIYGIKDAHIIMLGDMINGNIHPTVRLENRENTIKQTMLAAELLTEFVYKLRSNFRTVHVNSVSGNHSRIGEKDFVLRDERLDDVVLWYMKAKLSHLPNIIISTIDNYDSTIGSITVKGKEYLIVHGDFDTFDEKGVMKILTKLDLEVRPAGIFYGHLHRNGFDDDVCGLSIIRSGTFAGSADNHTIQKRLSGKPSQMLCVVDSTGIRGIHPIKLA